MINNHWQQLMDEARNHWQHMLAASTVIRQAFPLQEWIRIAVVALVTAVVTSQITLARLDERITALRNERVLLVTKRDEQLAMSERKRDEQVNEIKRHMERMEAAIVMMQVQLAGMKK